MNEAPSVTDRLDRLNDNVAWANTCTRLAVWAPTDSPERLHALEQLRQFVRDSRPVIEELFQGQPLHDILAGLRACEDSISMLETGLHRQPEPGETV